MATVTHESPPPDPDAGTREGAVALVVDMDGTLVRTDTLHESVLLIVRLRPLDLLRFPFWIAHGKAAFKERIAERATVNPHLLPLDERVVNLVASARADGRRTVLATASHHRTAQAVAERVGAFDEVMATQGTNLSGRNKRDALVARFGARGFDYVGNSEADRPVWSAARRALVVNAPPRLLRALQREHGNVQPLEPRRPHPLPALLDACRLYQWVKNLLVFVPLLAAHALDAGSAARAGAAFLCFGLAASASYLVNDLLDLEADRRHARKSRRAFASGSAQAGQGAVLALALYVAAFAGAVVLAPAFAGYLLAYVVTTTLYSLFLKRYPLLDVIVVAGLYTTRIVAGGAATGIPVSLWLLGFSMFLFTSLAFAKRYSETSQLEARGEAAIAGRGYRAGDSAVLMALGTSAGMAAVLTLALYVSSSTSANLYRRPELLWALCPMLLYWIGRIWLAAQRNILTDDPIVFAFRDRTSVLVLALAIVPIVLATL